MAQSFLNSGKTNTNASVLPSTPKRRIKSSYAYIVKVQYGLKSEDKIKPHAFEKLDSGMNHGRMQAVFLEFSHDGRLADI